MVLSSRVCDCPAIRACSCSHQLTMQAMEAKAKNAACTPAKSHGRSQAPG